MKDSKKMIVGAVLYTLLYIGIIYASLCLGYIHPFSGYMLRWFLLCLQGFRICI